MASPPAPHVRVRIDFESGQSVGPGKIALLERIEASGSLSQAARDLGLSYRRAWLLLDDLNHAFTEPVVITATGGVHGGGARLTAQGRRLIVDYRKVETAATASARRQFKTLRTRERRPEPPTAASRRPLSRRLKG
jgi:molybdate transport system regulatory protein